MGALRPGPDTGTTTRGFETGYRDPACGIYAAARYPGARPNCKDIRELCNARRSPAA
jgi:hypothetical protein